MSNALKMWELSGCSRHKLAAKAEEMEIPVLKAIDLRIKRIKQELSGWNQFFGAEDDLTHSVAYSEIIALLSELEKLESRPTHSEIDERRVERAREYHIPDMVEFKMNKTKCVHPLHNDKTASLHYYAKNNSCYCHGCHEYMDAIDVYRYVNGCNFATAIREMTR